MRLWVWVLGQWVAVVWYLSCWFVQWDCVGLCWIFGMGFAGVYYGWVPMGWVHGGRGGLRWGGFSVVEVGL